MTTNPDTSRIVVGVDGSSSSIHALRYAGTLSSALGAPLHVITTWRAPMADGGSGRSTWSAESDAQSILTESIEQAFADSPPAELTASIVPGPAARTLIERSRGARMLVLGSRGRGGFVGLLLGSVSATCAQHAHCPVLIVHDRVAEESPSSDEP